MNTIEFGGSGITQELYDYIVASLPKGKTILELGSGDVSTRLLSQHYLIISVEDKSAWIDKYSANYIYAPLANGWYDLDALVGGLDGEHYDMILVDGPTGEGNRGGFLTNLALFNTNVPIIFDDTNRPPEKELARSVAMKLRRSLELFTNFSVVALDRAED